MGLVLASASPRRLALLKQIGITPHATHAPRLHEIPQGGEIPTRYVQRIARAKALAIADACAPDDWILAADTEVVVGRRILGKPASPAEADRFLQLLSGRRHRVLTAVVLMRGDTQHTRSKLTTSIVKMAVWDKPTRTHYIASGEWQGKAGGYALQGLAAAQVAWIQGSYSGIIGLPLAETAGLLRRAGLMNSLDRPAKNE